MLGPYEKKNCLLVVHDVYQDFNMFPLGVGYLASILREKGYSVEIYCMDVFHYTNEMLEKKLFNSEYDLIGTGFMNARFEETIIDLCNSINKYKKDAWFFLGGLGPTPIAEYVLKRTKTDFVLMGDAELTLIELLEAKLENKPLDKILGLAFRRGNKVTINDRRPPLRDLDSLPFPAWDLFPMQSYTQEFLWPGMEKNEKFIPICASRGCTDTCNFCYRMEKGIRFRKLEKVIEEIKLIKERYGVTFFMFVDELFVFPRKRVFEFEDLLKKNNLKIKWYCQSRADLFDEEVANSLKRSGCKFVNIGIESMDQAVLDKMNKRMTVEQNIKALEVANKVDIGLGLNFLWGQENDTEETLRKNVEALKSYNKFDQIRTIRPPTPYPGSSMYNDAINKGLLKGPEDFFKKFKNSDLLVVNMTEFSDKKFYELLFEANKELILHHFKNTTKDMKEAQKLIDDFHNLYFKKKYSFRGARTYKNKNS